tara:strand:- start:219 stop:464 length:246 start_codon:yes stop_codon:yes gene_type:complete
MSSEIHKYTEKALNKNKNFFSAQVLNFPNDKTIDASSDIKTKNDVIWEISDKSNDDQLKAVTGICFMIGILLVIGLYSNLS